MRYENTMRYACQCPIQQKPVQPLDWSDSQESRAREKTRYNDRIIQVENGTFTPLIFGSNGAMGYECEKFHKELALKLSIKRSEILYYNELDTNTFSF